jgi:hypothetical protein
MSITDFTAAKRRVGRRRRQVVQPPPAPAGGPVLVSADFVDNTLSLTFDRAIDTSGIMPGDVVVNDGTTGIEWGGTGDVVPVGTHAFNMVMIEQGGYGGAGVVLDAATGAGIVSVEGGVAWAGVEDLALPFPA